MFQWVMGWCSEGEDVQIKYIYIYLHSYIVVQHSGNFILAQ